MDNRRRFSRQCRDSYNEVRGMQPRARGRFAALEKEKQLTWQICV